jgi:hypothetical protein
MITFLRKITQQAERRVKTQDKPQSKKNFFRLKKNENKLKRLRKF